MQAGPSDASTGVDIGSTSLVHIIVEANAPFRIAAIGSASLALANEWRVFKPAALNQL